MQQLTRLFWFSSLALPAGELRQWRLALASYSNKTKYLNLMSGEVKSPVWGSPKGRPVQDQGAGRLWVRPLPCPSTDTFILCLDVTEDDRILWSQSFCEDAELSPQGLRPLNLIPCQDFSS